MLNYEKFLTMSPGKYWKLPENKKHLLDKYLEDTDYIAMIKYDGYWARIVIQEEEIIIQSRGISTVTKKYGEYQDKVPHIVAELRELFPAGTVLLGELCYTELNRTATEVGSVLRSLPKRAVKLQEDENKKLHLCLFDCLAFNHEEVYERPLWSRITNINNKNKKYIHSPVVSHINLEALLVNVWEQGGEGIILLNKDMPYNIGNSKAWHSIKVKRELGELEAPVIDLIAPNMIYEGDNIESWNYWRYFDRDESGQWVEKSETDSAKAKNEEGTVKLPVTKPYYFKRNVGVIVNYLGRTINITSGLTEDEADYLNTEEARGLIENKKLIAVFTGMSLTEDSIRHPRLIRLRDEA